MGFVQDLIEIDKVSMRLQVQRSILAEFDATVKSHERYDAEYFIDDKNYEFVTSEAIGLKSRGSNKLKVFLRYLYHEKETKLDQILALQLEHFDQESGQVDMEIESGVLDFPWKDVANKNPQISFTLAWNVDKTKLLPLMDTLKQHVIYNLHSIKFSDENITQEISFSPHLLHCDGVELGAVGLSSGNHFEVLCLFLSLLESRQKESENPVNVPVTFRSQAVVDWGDDVNSAVY